MGIDPLIPLDIASSWLSISPQVLTDLLKEGAMPYHIVGKGKERRRIRIKQSVLLEYIEQTEVKPTELKLRRTAVA